MIETVLIGMLLATPPQRTPAEYEATIVALAAERDALRNRVAKLVEAYTSCEDDLLKAIDIGQETADLAAAQSKLLSEERRAARTERWMSRLGCSAGYGAVATSTGADAGLGIVCGIRFVP